MKAFKLVDSWVEHLLETSKAQPIDARCYSSLHVAGLSITLLRSQIIAISKQGGRLAKTCAVIYISINEAWQAFASDKVTFKRIGHSLPTKSIRQHVEDPITSH